MDRVFSEVLFTSLLVVLSKASGRNGLRHIISQVSPIIKKFLKFFLIFVLSVHAIIIIIHVSNKVYIAEEVKVTQKLSNVVGPNETLKIIDKTEVKFLLTPKSLCSDSMVLMVLSAPNNVDKRNSMRQRLLNVSDVQLIFLLGSTQKYQALLEIEHSKYDDIVQASVPDSYDTLSYKSIFGFLWINIYCKQTKYVTKTDDDVTLDLEKLKNTLDNKYGKNPPDTMECPSVIRFMRPLKQKHRGTIMGKFFITTEELKRRVYPDLCFGWLYVTTPMIGLSLAEVASIESNELIKRANRDDYFITGFLREKLPWIKMRQLDGGIWGLLWDNFFSRCTWLGVTKNVFFNNYVINKSSGSVSYVKGWRMYLCIIWEFYIMGGLEWLAPESVLYWVQSFQFCVR